MHRVTLPDNQWADIRDPEEITVRGKRTITAISVGIADLLETLDPSDLSGVSEQDMDAMMRLSEAGIVAMLAGWSYPDPLPTIDTVGDMPSSRFEALEVATAKGSAAVALGLDTSSGSTPDPKDLSGDSGS